MRGTKRTNGTAKFSVLVLGAGELGLTVLRHLAAGARLLPLCTPAGLERVVTTLGAPAKARTLPPAGWQPPETSLGQRERLFADLGMQPVAVSASF